MRAVRVALEPESQLGVPLGIRDAAAKGVALLLLAHLPEQVELPDGLGLLQPQHLVDGPGVLHQQALAGVVQGIERARLDQ